MENKYYDESIIIDFEIPDDIKKDIENLLNERKKEGSLQVDYYMEDLISDCNNAYNENRITSEQRAKIRDKYL